MESARQAKSWLLTIKHKENMSNFSQIEEDTEEHLCSIDEDLSAAEMRKSKIV